MAENNLLELDFNSKLEIKINNEHPVQLVDLTIALLGVGQLADQATTVAA